MWLYINIYEQLTLQLFWNTNTITWNYTMRNRNFNEVIKKSILLKLKAFKCTLFTVNILHIDSMGLLKMYNTKSNY